MCRRPTAKAECRASLKTENGCRFLSKSRSLPASCILKPWLRTVFLLVNAACLLWGHRQVYALQFSPPLPVIYEGHNDAEVEVFVDLTPEEKSKLTGSGVITVELSSLSLEFSGGTWISIPYSGRETTPQSTAVLRKKARHPMRTQTPGA